MLGRTAGGLYWMYRYLERAENTSRLVAAGQRIALTRTSSSDDEWVSILQTASVYDGFLDAYGDVTKDAAIDWMLRDPSNPSSIISTIEAARTNARMVRTALTHEVWEVVNGSWMALKEALARKVGERDLPHVLDLVRERTALVRGATHGTMLRNDIYDFLRIGTFTERADNTARILDVKYYVLLPSAMAVGSRLDNVQWESILRSLSAAGGYRMVHGNRPRPRNIAEFMILDTRMPRSLHFCLRKLQGNLGYLVRDYEIEPDSHRMATEMVTRFEQGDIDEIVEQGLHEYLQNFLTSLGAVNRQVEIDFRFYE